MFFLGTLFALPYVCLFFAVWIVAMLIKPLTVMSLLCVMSSPSSAFRKLQLFCETVQYLAFCKDKKWKAPKEDPLSFFKDAEGADGDGKKIVSKTIFFVRHGESTWNDTFNKGDRSKMNFILYFLPNLVYAATAEWFFWVTGRANESWFYDAPLSDKGKGQAMSIQKYLQTDLEYMTPNEAQLLRLLLGFDDPGATEANAKKQQKSPTPGKPPAAQLVSSNLRRAISTMAIGFSERLDLKLTNDKILLLPQLQEISFNPDALSITPAYGKVVPAWTDPKSLTKVYDSQIDTSKHSGNKPITSNGYKRMQDFCRVVFDEISNDTIICGGHSLWFRSFFRTYLPHSFEHVCKKKKLINGGIVSFTLQRITTGKDEYHYMIEPKSLTVLHGGF